MKTIKFCVFLILLMLARPSIIYAAGKKKFVPSPVPVNIKPISITESYWGVGYNYLQIQTQWKDDFFTQGGTEDIGEKTHTVHNIAFAYLKSESNDVSIEYDILIGIIESKNKTNSYYSDKMAQNIDVAHSGGGYDIGSRYLRSKTIATTAGSDGKKFIDWNWAISFHGALFSLESETKGTTADNQWSEEYREWEWGIFLRPVISIQPLVRITDYITVIPYVGAGTTITVSFFEWENIGDYIEGGSPQPEQMGYGSGSYTSYSGLETYVGFDLGIITSKERKHQLTIGGVLSKFFLADDSDFFEIHMIYTVPF